MVSRKRTRAEAEEEGEEHGHENSVPASLQQGGLLQQIRNMWEFANLMQYIFTFGKLVKISDNIEIDDLETECLKPGPSQTLQDIGLSLLKFVSSHRGLTYDNFEEYTRRQYYAKAPTRNPFGDDEQPTKFNDFDVFQKIRILQQLSAWTFWNPDRIREKMPEQRETEQAQWRVEEVGYDRDDRLYYVLDDNRLYRRTDPPIPPPKAPKPKANSKRGRALARAARKKKLSETNDEKEEEDAGENNTEEDPSKGYKWECIAVTLSEYQTFLASIQKTKDPNEKILRDSLTENVVPVLEEVEEAQRRKIQRREKELINMQKMANAKRSSRLAGKQERERQAMEAAEEERRREAERIAARKEEEKKEKIEKDRLYRLMTREQRLKDREEKRKQREEQVASITEQAQKTEDGKSRVSERQRKTEMDKRERDLAALQAEEEQWFFDCSGCGVHGENLDDGSHSVACEKCNVWQHSKCLDIPQEEAEKDDFHFICKDCKRRIEEAKRPKLPPLKFRIPKSTSASPSDKPKATEDAKGEREQHPLSPKHKREAPAVEIPRVNLTPTANGATVPAAPGAIPRPDHPTQCQPQPIGSTYAPSTTVNGSLSWQQRLQPMQNVTVYQGHPQQAQLMVQNSAGAASATAATSGYGGTPTTTSAQANERNPPLNIVQHYHPGQLAAPPASSASTSFNSQRPSSSHSRGSPVPSPIQNRPSMSPTQGNRDVGPLAGFPTAPQSNGAPPSTPFGSQSQARSVSGSPYPVGPPPNQSSPPQSFHSTTTPQAAPGSFNQTSPSNRYSPGVPMSGLSPTKHSSPRVPASNTGDVGSAAVLPPVQNLQPSPELMGRSSPDEPIPAPTKTMSPEQEDKRRQEDMLAAQHQKLPRESQESHLDGPPPSTQLQQQQYPYALGSNGTRTGSQ